MIYIINNCSGVNVSISIGGTSRLIYARDTNIEIEVQNSINSILVKRANALQLPDHRKMIFSELFGGVVRLFMNPELFVFDVSSGYFAKSHEKEFVEINIVKRVIKSNPDVIYDIVCIESNDIDLNNPEYKVENKIEVSNMYKMCRRKAHFWLYIILEVVFTLLGLLVSYPLLISIYLATNTIFIRIIMAFIPFFLIGTIALVGILPLHMFFTFVDKGFYRSMENKEISFYINKSETK